MPHEVAIVPGRLSAHNRNATKGGFSWTKRVRHLSDSPECRFTSSLREWTEPMERALAESGRGVVVMINANDNSRIMGRILRFVAVKYNWPEESPSVPAATERMAPGVPLETIAGRYELSNTNMLTLAPHASRLFTDVNGLPDEEFLFIGGDRFGSTERDGSAVARVLFYRMETAAGNRWLLVHVTSDNLITDYDVVDK